MIMEQLLHILQSYKTEVSPLNVIYSHTQDTSIFFFFFLSGGEGVLPHSRQQILSPVAW